MSTALFILGMHRSGTSATAGVCRLLGAEFGQELMPPSKDNEKGFFEDENASRLNDLALYAAGLEWSDTGVFPEGWRAWPEIKKLSLEIGDTAQRFAGHADLWAIKDPRASRTLPLWHEALKKQGVEARHLIVVRHPLEVWRSLEKRDGFTLAKAQLLWLRHMFEAERVTRGAPRVFLYYPQLLDDWKAAMMRVAEKLGVQWKRGYEEAEREVAQFLAPSLRHHAEDESSLASDAVWPWTRAAFAIFKNACAANEVDSDVLDKTAAEMQAVFAPLEQDGIRKQELLRDQRAHIEAMGQTVMALAEEMRAIKMQAEEEKRRHDDALAVLERRLDDVYASASWRVTEPLRRISARLKKA